MLHQHIDITSKTAEPVAHPADCTKEMGVSLPEFLRQLGTLSPAADIRLDGSARRVRLAHAGGLVTISYHPEKPRKLGALTIPVTRVEIRFQGISPVEAGAFLGHWDRTFLRMGG